MSKTTQTLLAALALSAVQEPTPDVVPGLDEFGTPVPLPFGVNGAFVTFLTDLTAGPVADDGAITITLPAQWRGVSSLPFVLAVVTYGAGAVGARTATFYPIVNTGSALVGVEVVSYVEATGVLTLTNRSGGAMSAIRVLLGIVADSE